MSDNENQYQDRLEQVDRYLQGQMSPEEQKSFEHQMEADPSLQKEVEQGRIFLLTMENLEDDELRGELRKTNEVLQNARQSTEVNYNEPEGDENDKQDEPRVIPISSYYQRIVATAAAVILLLIPGYFLFLQDDAANALFNEHYETPANTIPGNTRSEADINQQLQKVTSLYENGSYTKAVQEANAYLANNPNDYEVRFYRGIMYIELDRYKKAIEELKQVEANTTAFATKAQWYMAMAHLALDQTKEAKAILKQLSQEPNKYNDRAETIVNGIE